MSKISIVFFGSGPVAAKSLELLIPYFDIEAVITKPKPPHHRDTFPVIELAEQNSLALHTVSNKHELSNLFTKSSFRSKLAVLIDFGIIVSQDVIDFFPKGIVNSHFSLLPEWRGADPITFAILSGQPKTGVSLMIIDKGMDTGKIIKQQSIKIQSNETTQALTDKLIVLSNEMLSDTLPKYLMGEAKARSQPHPSRATYSRKILKQDGLLDFSKSAEQLEREIRAFAQWPKSKTTLANIDVIVTSAHVAPSTSGGPGKIVIDTQAGLIMIQCKVGYLCIDKLKPAGKSEMTAKSFIAGYSQRLSQAHS